MTSGHADGHRIKMVPWFSLTLDSFLAKRPRSMSKTCPRTHLRCGWVLESRRSHPVSNFQPSSWWFFRSFRLRNKSAVPMLNLGQFFGDEMVPWWTPRKCRMALGNGCPRVSGLLNCWLLYRCSFVFFRNCFTRDVDPFCCFEDVAWHVFVHQWHPDPNSSSGC